jgi:transmembrane sensor
MNNVQVFSSKKDILQQACEWISRFDRGLDKTEEHAFADWVNISKTHRTSLFEVAQTWDDLSVLNELSTLFPLRNTQVPQTHIFTNKKVWGTAASLAFVFVSCLAWLVNTQIMSTMAEPSLLVFNAKTSVGEQRVIPLADGSVIHLNTDSFVSVDFSDSRRDVHLLRGEAHFDVAHDENRPFIVKASDNSVTAVGTSFNVQITSAHQLELLVTDGKVLVKNKQDKDSIADLSHPLDGFGELMIEGQKALISQQSIQQLELSDEQVQNELAWQQGMLVFHGEPLAVAMQEISRYTSIKFTLADDKVKQRRVAGYFKAGDIQGLLFALENNFNIVYVKLDAQSIVLSSGY